MKILFSGFRDENHSSAGGYDKIANFPGGDYICDQDVPLGRIPVGKSGKCLNIFFLDIVTRCLRYQYDITHIFYGDTIIFPYLRNRKHKLVVTIHLDIEKRKRLPSLFKLALKRVDGVVVLSSQQECLLREKYGIKARFIPHGFQKPIFSFRDPNTFVPCTFSRNMINIFYSGTNYRNTSVLIHCIKFCQDRRLNVFFHLVGQSNNLKEKIEPYSKCFLYGRLSDDEYFSLLSICDYNFLPLTFATANNALLEAQFLGIKSILPSIAGIEDYAAPSELNMFYDSENDLESIFSSLHKSNSSLALQKYSERFLWENIYKQLELFYKEL